MYFVALLHRLGVDPEVAARLARLDVRDDGYGVDAFGLDRSWLPFGLALTSGLYRRWFRVASRGHENLPPTGAGIVAANHSGTLPFDAAMLWADILRKSDPPRLGRAVADQFVADLPFVSTLFARTGAIGSSRGNLERVLERGDLVMVFPEGTPGIGKPFSERYKLQRWRVGHVELALRHRVPVIPTAIFGAEEQMPLVARLPIRWFGAPYVPVPVVPFPLPVRYHLRYGAPLHLHDVFAEADPADPVILQRGADLVSGAVAELIAAGLAERKGVFR